jgi:hypothetical protein
LNFTNLRNDIQNLRNDLRISRQAR